MISNFKLCLWVFGVCHPRYEMTALTPDEIISQSMDKQAAAERTRREMVTLAEAKKRSVELDAEAQLIRVQVRGWNDDTLLFPPPPYVFQFHCTSATAVCFNFVWLPSARRRARRMPCSKTHQQTETEL